MRTSPLQDPRNQAVVPAPEDERNRLVVPHRSFGDLLADCPLNADDLPARRPARAIRHAFVG